MHRLILCLLPFTLLFSCNKEPDFNIPFGANGEMTFRGEELPLSTGLASLTPDGGAPEFWGITLSGLLSSNGVQLSVRQTDGEGLPAGTFQFCNECVDEGFLFDGGITVTVADEFIAGTLSGGSVTIDPRGGDSYRITFDLTYGMSDAMTEERVVGSFEGTVLTL